MTYISFRKWLWTLLIFLRIAFSVCLSFSVTHRGVASSMFHAEYNSEFKVCSLGVDEHAGTGYSFAFA